MPFNSLRWFASDETLWHRRLKARVNRLGVGVLAPTCQEARGQKLVGCVQIHSVETVTLYHADTLGDYNAGPANIKLASQPFLPCVWN